MKTYVNERCISYVFDMTGFRESLTQRSYNHVAVCIKHYHNVVSSHFSILFLLENYKSSCVTVFDYCLIRQLLVTECIFDVANDLLWKQNNVNINTGLLIYKHKFTSR